MPTTPSTTQKDQLTVPLPARGNADTGVHQALREHASEAASEQIVRKGGGRLARRVQPARQQIAKANRAERRVRRSLEQQPTA